MLEYLRIRNLALIEDMELEFVQGLNVLTGETGAGKSFILKALSFVTGERLGAELVRPGQDKAVVEALFSLPEQDLIIRRELSGENGRSRFFINDKLSSQETIKELKPSLLLHTSQHEQQRLLQPNFQARLLEIFSNNTNIFEEKELVHNKLKDLNIKRNQLVEKSKLLAEKREFLEHQQKEIAKVAPEHNEEEDLEKKQQSLKHQEANREAKEEAIEFLRGSSSFPGINEQIPRLRQSLKALKKIAPDLIDEDSFVQAQDTFTRLESQLRKISINHVRGENTEEIEARLYELAQLKRKLKRSLPEILALSEEIEENLSFLDACVLDLKQLAKEEAVLAAELFHIVEEINIVKADTAIKLSQDLASELQGLGFSEHLQLQFAFTPHEIYPACGKIAPCVEQRARLLWIPNPGQSPQPLDKIASGGELSRFLLGLVGLTVKLQKEDEQATLIFDEVDAGVGGITLNHLAQRIDELSEKRQVLLITHWPRLAAHGERHFVVEKNVNDGKTFTLCRQLNPAQRHEEIVRMAGGGAEGEALAGQLINK